MSQLVGRRLKETPREAQTISHIYTLRGGYIRPVSTGIYSLLPLGYRVIAKIEQIIREEMDRVDGQEVLLPVVLPAELWEESGRYAAVGPELLRFKDRNDKAMLLGMTHEEAVVHLCRSEVTSYKQLPVMLYQIQTKYRDEARARAGLIRVREFTMKDAYSFHATQECLVAYYQRAHEAYERIFRRLGMREVVSIQSDTGMMGGKVAHEFMALAECGEDTIFMSPDGRYKANREVATSALTFPAEAPLPLEKVHTPGKKSIEEVAGFLGVPASRTGKAVFYRMNGDQLVFVVIRGDFEVNETKLKNYLKATELAFANDAQIRAIGAEPGYASPLSVDPAKVRIVFDRSARESGNLVVGANEPDYHYRNFNFSRDLAAAADRIEVVDVATVRAGDPCPVTGQPLEARRGIEVGNIFQLGTKYSAAMNCTFLDQEGKTQPMIMGCYGIGVGRALAAVIEQCHDDHGPIWPLSIAPYQVHLCVLNLTKEGVQPFAEKLYADLQAAGLEVLFDDRNEKAGFAFNDADLIGCPYRLIVSPRNLEAGQVEFKTRDGSRQEMLPAASVVTTLADLVRQGLAASRQ
jgi:prolyl-tRNA synthetase